MPRELIESAFGYLRACGVKETKIFCKPEAFDPAANGFMRKSGFELRGPVMRWGIDSNLYVRRLSPLPHEANQ